MQATMDTKLEAKRMLFTYAQTVRRWKKRPELSAAMAEEEIKLGNELHELEARAGKQGKKE